MPTTAEILKASGFDDAAIAALDQRAIAAFDGVLTTAQQQREQAEIAQRAANELFEKEINPALVSWGNREANLTAEVNYYKTLAEKAKDGGFVADVPPFQPQQQQAAPGGQNQPRNPQNGQWQQVPGSPDIRELENRVGQALGVTADLQWKYRTLFGSEMPDSPTALAAEAAQRRIPLADYAAQKYDFSGKEKAIAEQKQREREDKIRAEAQAEVEKKYAERFANNPNLRQAEPSRFADLQKAVVDGSRQDPVKMTPDQRRAATRSAIHKDVAEAHASA